jgi:hypothetical protein
MKKYILLLIIISLLSCKGFAQLNIPSGTQWVNIGNVTVVMNNLDLLNNGIFSAGNSSIKFTGNQNSSITGTSMPTFSIIEVAKTNNAKIILGRNINVGSSINFISGLLDLNNNNITLDPTAYIEGETENNRITGTNGGYIEITQNLNAPLSANPGYLGAVMTSAANLGPVTIRRGHIAQSGTGLSGSIQRYFIITPQNNSGLNATLRFNYFDAETNGKDENNFVLFQSDDNGVNWTNQSQSNKSAVSNYVEKTALSSLSKFTLSDFVVSTCSATGVVLSVKDAKQNTVAVSWSTATETNNQGFGVERRLNNEAGFTQIAFVNSKAVGGNSSAPLSYTYTDNNAYTDTSFYRLKIVGLNNSTCYSDTKFFVPKGKKGPGGHNLINTDTTVPTTANKNGLFNEKNSMPRLNVGPNPNNGNFWFTVSGIEKETMASLYTIDGKALKQFHVFNFQQQYVNDLRSGVYILKVEGLQPFRIVVQSDGNTTK